MNNKKIYRHIADLPSGTASDTLTEGCLVLEGGGWKGLYTVGVLDCMMKNDINFSSVVGVSAGALSAIGYVSGQIGWGARIDLTYRHDKNYCGIGAFKRDKGITGFSYLFDDILKELPLDENISRGAGIRHRAVCVTSRYDRRGAVSGRRLRGENTAVVG